MIFLYEVMSLVQNSFEVDFNIFAHAPFKKLFNESRAISGIAGL